MRVTVNGQSTETPAATVADLVAELAEGRGGGVAVALNGEVVPRSDWARAALRDEDSIEVLTAVAGG